MSNALDDDWTPPHGEDESGITPDTEPLPNGTELPAYQHPFPEGVTELRPGQVTAIREAIGHWEEGTEVVFLEAPVGTGKTIIGFASEEEQKDLGLLPPDNHGLYICSDKELQDQFVRDMRHARTLKGRANYPTMLGPMDNLTADDCTARGPRDPCLHCDPKNHCPYNLAKHAAKSAPMACLNTAMFLNMANFTHDWRRNNFVIADEADMLEKALLGFVTYEIRGWIVERLRLEIPKKGVHKPTLIKWLHDVAAKADVYLDTRAEAELEPKHYRAMESFFDETRVIAMRLEQDYIASQREDLGSDPEDENGGTWLRDYETRTFKMVPVMVDTHAPRNLWSHGKRWLLMSGTIISPEAMARELGLDTMFEWGSVTIPSPFPRENRKVYIAPVADVTRNLSDEDFDRLIYAVERIAFRHPGRMLVHSVSYKMTERIVHALNVGNRPVISYSGKNQPGLDKSDAIALYKRTPNAIIVAPSMDRGVDLKGDLCECQVIIKVPFPYLGDRRVSARLNLPGRDGDTWYAVQAIRDLVQMCGRGVRTPTDVCPTYILDAQFPRNLWRKRQDLFPAYFREGIVTDEDITWLFQ